MGVAATDEVGKGDNPCLGRCGAQAPEGEFTCAACAPRFAKPSRERERPSAVRPLGVLFAPGMCALCREERATDDALCGACVQRTRAETAEREREAERKRAKELAWRRSAALRRIPFAFPDDRDAYEAAVSDKRLRAVGDRYTLDRGSLLILGRSGTGKTVSVARAVRRLIQGATDPRDPILGVYWLDGTALAHARRQHRLGDGEPPEIDAAIRASVLVIDELLDRADDGDLLRILQTRYPRGKPTLTTSGARLADLEKAYGVGAVRRLYDPTGRLIEVWS